MKDELILKRLYEIKDAIVDKQTAVVYQKIIDWIVETQTTIASDSMKNIGMGSSIKSIKKIISSNKKSHPEWAHLIRSNTKACIVSDGEMAVKFRQDPGLPATSLQKDYADMVINRINRCADECKTALTPPPRASLDLIIKDWNALPKNIRPNRPVYDFGKGLPKVDAEKLMTILPIFPSNTCFVCKERGSVSPLYFKWETYEGLLMPITR